MRQDPDVIMVGEVRDEETARIAIQAALTGHLVFSTLHTNDSASALTRLVDMGIEPYLLTSSVTAILAQRLVRRICPHCKEVYEPTEFERQLLKEYAMEQRAVYKGKGLPRVPQYGLPGKDRHIRAPHADQQDQTDGPGKGVLGGDKGGGDKGRDGHPAAGRHRQGPRGRHHVVRNRPGHHRITKKGPLCDEKRERGRETRSRMNFRYYAIGQGGKTRNTAA